VLIVDDSRIFRAALEEVLADQEGITVVGSVFNGEKALQFIQRSPPDLVTLDVEMPGMDGFQTLQAIQKLNATRPEGEAVGVVMVSAFTRQGADVTVRALQAGAFDFVTKPTTSSGEVSLELLRQQLVSKIRSFMARRSRKQTQGDVTKVPARSPSISDSWLATLTKRLVRAVLIASSTGGPRALATLLPELGNWVNVPIFVVQHMPADFTRSLAENLTRQTRHRVIEAQDGEFAQPKTVYIAPGGKHLLLRSGPCGQIVTGVNEQPPENGCRPSADVLFRAAAAVLGGETVAVVLTGMGCDGTAGLKPLKRAGGCVLAQDEATSVVWGMPGSAVAAGLVDAVLPLEEIAAAVRAMVAGKGKVR